MRPDLARGVRCMVSFMAPLLMSAYGHLPVINMVFTAIAAQSLANVDVRGPYSLRVTLLLAKSAIIAAAAALGALTGNPLWLALLATALIAIGAGYWRRLSTEYGPSLAVASGLVFYIALAYPGGPAAAEHHFVAAFFGGCWGMLLQIAFWPFRAQHPLRVAVSDAWLATADLIAAISTKTAIASTLSGKSAPNLLGGENPGSMPPTASGPVAGESRSASRPRDVEGPAVPSPGPTPAAPNPSPLLASIVDAAASAMATPQTAHLSAIGVAETNLRPALERAYAVLDSAAPEGKSRAVDRLRELTKANARLALRITAYFAARESFSGRTEDWEEYEAPLLRALQNLARTFAIAVVSRNPGHLAMANVRAQRAAHLAHAVREKAEALAGGAPLADAASEIERHLAEAAAALAATIDRAGERVAFSLELTDLSEAALRPLAIALNFHGPWDRALVRFTARIGLLTLIGVSLMKLSHATHGYWLPFTMIIVLQPDYGSTRQKAAQRLLGTVGGSVAASGLLALHPPWAILMTIVALCCFVFGYYLKRNYALSVIFITVFVVALTDSFAPQTFALAGERLGFTLAGGLLALAAAFLFWPFWERDRVRPILARGLRANAELLRLSFAQAAQIDQPAIVRARRRAESANAEVFSSLQRMAGDPKDQQDRLETLAAIANGNQRLTRALALALLRHPPAPPRDFVAGAADALEDLAQGFDTGRLPAALAAHRSALTRTAPPVLARAAAEISALILETADFEFASVPLPTG